MAGPAYKVDVAIVGCGALGTLVAAEMRVLGEEITVAAFRLSDRARPQAESLRNQGWWQSGIRYVTPDPIAGLAMREARSELREYLGAKTGEDIGIIQMDAADEPRFLAQEGSIFRREIRKLPKRRAQQLLGSVWDDSSVCYEVPEQHLDIPTMIETARDFAVQQKVVFREVNEVRLERQRGYPSVRLVVDGQRVEALVVVFTAGCGNLRFMEELGHEEKYKIHQTPLLVVSGSPAVQVPIVVDRKNGMSIVSHRPCDRIANGCMIIGAAKGKPIPAYSEASERCVTESEAESILSVVGRILPSLRSDSTAYRFTAGWEPLPPNGSHVSPRVLPFPANHEHHDVLFAFCGRATLALDAARDVVKAIGQILSSIYRGKRTRGHLTARLGETWTDPVRMHFYDYYAAINDYHGKKKVK